MSDNEKKIEIQEKLWEIQEDDKQVEERIKKEDKKKVGIFIAMMIGSVTFGAFIGFFMRGITRKDGVTTMGVEFYNIMHDFALSLGGFARIAIIVVAVVGIVASACLLKASKKHYERWDKEDEDELDKLEGKLNLGLMISNITYILGLVLMGLSFYILDVYEFNKTFAILIIASLVSFIVTLIATIVIQKGYVNLTKTIYPEKSGSVYDMKFQKKWFESCDEAEQLMIYKAAFGTYRKMNSLLTTLLVIFVCVGMFVEIGVLPLILTGGMLLFLNLSYMYESIKLGKKNNIELPK